jgi:hypothetical protein
LLTHSSITHPEVSSVVFLGFFCLLGCSFLSIWVIYYVEFDLHIVSIFSCSPVFCQNWGLYLIPLQSLYLLYDLSKCIRLLFISYISSLLLLFLLQLLLYWSNFHCRITRVGRASVVYNFILSFFGLNTLFIVPVIFRYLFNFLPVSISFS